jgi:hypothetical protein
MSEPQDPQGGAGGVVVALLIVTISFAVAYLLLLE